MNAVKTLYSYSIMAFKKTLISALKMMHTVFYIAIYMAKKS